MNEIIRTRVIQEANHILNTKDTIRKTAQAFAVSKSTVHMDLQKRLQKIDTKLAANVNEIFKTHNAIKHIRGGEATKTKYKRGQ